MFPLCRERNKHLKDERDIFLQVKTIIFNPSVEQIHIKTALKYGYQKAVKEIDFYATPFLLHS